MKRIIQWLSIIVCCLTCGLATAQYTTTYEYDSLSRLVKVDYPNGQRVEFEYDALGNRIGMTVSQLNSVQTITLSEGWNWFSTYIELDDPVELLEMLEEGLGEDAIQIKSQTQATAWDEDEEEWSGRLQSTGLTNDKTYMVQLPANTTITVTLVGPAATPEGCTIELNPNGWTWIGFPSAVEMDVNEAIAGFEAMAGDQLKSRNQTTAWDEDEEEWSGRLNTLVPGQGFMFYSASSGPRTLVFHTVHDYVDLGLPSGTLWATCNVGANAPEDYGDYFAWGETQPKDTYDWNTYQYCNGSYNTMTKYCTNSEYGNDGFVDNLTTLLPVDDAAVANWGNGWRMPTEDEWQELRDNTTHTWTTQNGVSGRLFTASNGNSLFLPAAGFHYLDNLEDAGTHGYYWSSSLYEEYPCNARRCRFYSSSCQIHDGNRMGGFPVRPVRSSQN